MILGYQAQRWYTNTTKGGQPCWHQIVTDNPADGVTDYDTARAIVAASLAADLPGDPEMAYRIAILADDGDGQHDEIEQWERELREEPHR